MIVLAIQSDIARLTRDFTALERRQLPFAIAMALTKTGQEVKAAEINTMRRVFDRPTRFTLNSLFVKPATKDRQEAKVWLKDWAAKGTPATRYLAPQIEGGPRSHKPFENLLIRAGRFPAGTYLVPAAGAPLDAYGNPSRGLYQKVLSALHAQRDAKQNSRVFGRPGRAKKGAQYFVPHQGGLSPGIWMRDGNGLRPLFVATRHAPRYRKRLPFFEVAADTIALEFAPQFIKAMNVATFGRKA